MPKPRAILKRVHAVKNIAKITNTMQMIATAKFKRAHDRAVAARPYTDRLGRLIAELSAAAGEFTHPLLDAREPKRVAILAIASNRGLCGGYNGGVTRELRALRARLADRGLDVELHVSGKRLSGALRFQQVAITAEHHEFDDRPRFVDVNEIVTSFAERYEAGDIDELHVVYTKFLSSARQRATSEQVLPLQRPSATDEAPVAAPVAAPDYIFSPSPETILSELLPRSVRLRVFQAYLDAAVSEQTARMIAMRSATDNAYDMIGDLTRVYNRSRQSQITTELNEIMGGAVALS